MNERLLDSENWKLEAEAVIRDIRDHVKDVKVSEGIRSTDSSVYLNVTTLEGRPFCVRLSARGFAVVGNGFDRDDLIPDAADQQHFETPYSLLESISPEYRAAFADALSEKLRGVQ